MNVRASLRRIVYIKLVFTKSISIHNILTSYR